MVLIHPDTCYNSIRLLIAEGGGAKSGGVAKQKSVGNVGKLTQVSLPHSAPLPALAGRGSCSLYMLL